MKPKILFLGSFPPPVHGSSMMMKCISDSQTVNESFDCHYINISISRNIGEVRKPTLKKVFRVIAVYAKTLYHLVRYSYDLVYIQPTCYGVPFLKDMPCMLMARWFCENRVIHQHNKGMSKCVDKWPYRWLIPYCYKGAKVILLSWKLYLDIEKVVGKENVMICPNGIPEPESIMPHIYGGPDQLPHIFYLGNLSPAKGVLVLLDAIGILRDGGYAFTCDFVGGETRFMDACSFAKEVESRGIGDCVVYHGCKYGQEKESFWQNSDVFVLPSLDECMPMVDIEAMQHKLPVVTTDVGGSSDVVCDGKTGFVCEPGNVTDLAEKLAILLNDSSLRRQMGEAGYVKYREQFTKEIFEQTICEQLAECCENR